MSRPQFDEGEFLRTLERLAKEQDKGDWSQSAFDPKVAKDARDEKLRGDRIERYHKALSEAGYRWVPAKVLGNWNDGSPHREGQWVHQDYDMQAAFTSDDVLQLFPGESGPMELYQWTMDKARRLAAHRAGIVLPPRG